MSLLHAANMDSVAAERPMRVVHVLDSIRLEAGGVVRAVIDMCNAFSQRGHSVVCMTFDDKDAPASWRRGESPSAAGEVVCERLTTGRGLAGMLSLADKRSCLRMRRRFEEADVVHLHTPWARVNLQAAKLCRATNTPYVLSAHGMLDDWSMSVKGAKKRVYLHAAGRRLLEDAAYVHCMTVTEHSQARKHYGDSRGYVAPCIFNASSFASLPRPDVICNKHPDIFDGDSVCVLFMGRVHYQKGIDILLRAFHEVSQVMRNARMVVAGPGDISYVNTLKKLSSGLGISDKVHFLGMVRGTDKISLYSSCDVLALPTHQENFGLVFVESLACGTPVIMTKAVGIWRELVETGGAWVADRTPEAFADALVQVLSDRDKLQRAGEKAREAIMRWLDPDRTIGMYERMYVSAIQGVAASA